VPLAIRGGGHSSAGHSTVNGGIVLDVREMTSLDIDAQGQTAWADAGLTAAEYTTQVGAHGLATGFGDTGSVGISGITLGGGIGFLTRKYGLTIDSLLAAEIVTADGEVLHVDSASHPDLFWAIRGGGGNFGVVTRFCYQLHPVKDIVGGMLLLPATPEVIVGVIAAADAAAEELSMQRSDASLRVAQIRVLGGAMARVRDDDTAFAHRRERLLLNVASFYDGPRDRPLRETWVKSFAAAVDQGRCGEYVGFVGDEGEAGVRAAYPGKTWDRLAAIKARYDPTSLFRRNQNVPPGVVSSV
jgi:FAD/FMN-containing dehydrogenase